MTIEIHHPVVPIENSVWVLTKTTESSDPDEQDYTSVIGIYSSSANLIKKLKRIAKANAQYKMGTVGNNCWRIGPEESEGFFGNSVVYLRAVCKQLDGGIE